MKSNRLAIRLTFLFLLTTIQAPASPKTSLFQCAAVYLTGIQGLSDQRNNNALYSIRYLKGMLGRTSNVASWRAAQFFSEVNDPNSKAAQAVHNRLNGIETDLFDNTNVQVKAFEVEGADAIKAHLEKVAATYREVEEGARSYSSGGISLQSIGETLLGLLFGGRIWGNRQQQMSNFLNRVADSLAKPYEPNALKRDAYYYSHNIDLNENALSAIRGRLNIKEFTEALNQPQDLTVLLDQMFYYDSYTRKPVLVTYYREWREPLPPPPKPPPKQRRQFFQEILDWQTGQLVPVPVGARARR